MKVLANTDSARARSTSGRYVWVTGVNHKVADVAIRESLAVGKDQASPIFQKLTGVVDEAVILSTCNRTEVYAASSRRETGEEAVVEVLASYAGLSATELTRYLYTYRGAGAARHLFAVSAGLDSMVPGETQILGQVKEALDLAQRHGGVAVVLSRLFREAISVAKAAHSTTRIGQRDASVSLAAVMLVRKIFGSSKPEGVLVVGAGKAASVAVQALVHEGMGPILVTNRTYEAAYQLTTRVGGRAVPFDDVVSALVLSDVVISATAAPHLVLRRPTIEAAMAQRSGRPLFLVDIAVPRDIDPTVGQLANVYLYDMDDLGKLSSEDLGSLQREADKVWRMVEERATEFTEWLESLRAVPVIVALRAKAEQVRQEELQEALAKLTSLSDEDRQVLDALTMAIVNKLLHHPIVELKKGNNGWSIAERLEAAHKLFGLYGEPHRG